MNFEIRDNEEYLPPEEDVYDVNDIEEREQFEALFGGYTSQEKRIRRGKIVRRAMAGFLAVSFLLVFVLVIRHCFFSP